MCVLLSMLAIDTYSFITSPHNTVLHCNFIMYHIMQYCFHSYLPRCIISWDKPLIYKYLRCCLRTVHEHCLPCWGECLCYYCMWMLVVRHYSLGFWLAHEWCALAFILRSPAAWEDNQLFFIFKWKMKCHCTNYSLLEENCIEIVVKIMDMLVQYILYKSRCLACEIFNCLNMSWPRPCRRVL